MRDAWLGSQSVSLIYRLFGGRLAPLVAQFATQQPLRVALTVVHAQGAAGPISLAIAPPGNAAQWLALWFAGTVAMLAGQAWHQWRVARLGEQLPAGSSPALVGLPRPRIALPVDFEARFTPAERELILAHEAVHRARLDKLWNLLAARSSRSTGGTRWPGGRSVGCRPTRSWPEMRR